MRKFSDGRPFGRNAFTLIELLVVIAIIALLVSIILPSLERARYLAARSTCTMHIRSQAQSILIYGDDYGDEFPRHGIFSPDYARAAQHSSWDNAEQLWYAMYGEGHRTGYIEDGGLMYCPLSAGLNIPPFADIHYVSGGGYGNWASEAPMIISAYMWFINLNEGGQEPDFDYGPGEPAWPKKLKDCTSESAMITHRITYNDPAPHEDWGHNGSGRYWDSMDMEEFEDNITTEDQPVGYGDGHVALHQNEDIRLRASWQGYQFHWIYY